MSENYNKIFIGEYYDIGGEVFVFARVGAHEWNFISVSAGQPYSEIPFSDVSHPWYREFDESVILNFFNLYTTKGYLVPKSQYARKLVHGEDFIVRVRSYLE